MSQIMIETVNLTRDYGPNRALDAVNLQVSRGQVMGFLGPNGAGKTTCMRILSGLLAPTSGSVSVAGVDVVANPDVAKRKIGFLPETPPIYGELTVREYLSYLAQLRGVGGKQRRGAVDGAMARCGLTHVAERLLRNLSKGYRQRAGIAQAIVHGPDVVILDEPTVGLDPIQIREIRDLIKELGQEHAVMLSTHILPEVRMTCDRVAVINGGRIVLEDSMAGLEARASEQHGVRVRFGAPPEPAAVEALDGVAAVHVVEGGWTVLPQAGADPIPALLAAAVTGGWDLRELTPGSNALEEVFVQLTTREESAESQQQEAA
ncbi:ABC transporter ATP-binding protein [Magnetofaba australis]|nr:ABC transporter ATP-binding protein [Magnetofaba australis]